MLTKTQKNRALKIFEGSKKTKPVKNARVIAGTIGATRRQVMTFLEDNHLRRYATGSYT